MSTRHRPLVLRCTLAIVMAALLVSACSNSTDSSSQGADDTTKATGAKGGASVAVDAPGVTDDAINFAMIGTKEGNPLGTCVLDCFLDGVKAYFAYRNSQGGIDGRKLEVSKVLDDQLGQNQQKSLEVISSDDVFGVFEAPLVASGYKDLDKAGIPTYTWAINFSDMSGLQSIYGNVGVLCVSCVERSPVYAAQLAGAKKIGILGYGVAAVSKECVAGQKKSVEAFSDKTGQKVVYSNDDLQFGLPNGIGPEVTAMKKAGVDFVVSCWELAGAKTLEQEMQRQGLGDVPMMNSNLYDAKFVADNAELFEGDIVRLPIRPFESNDTGALHTYKEWMKKTDADPSEISMYGWVNADLAYQGIKAAGADFDRAKVIAATNQMTAFDADGMINPIDWSRQHTAPTDDDPVSHGYAKECYAFVRVEDGKFDLVGDPDKPFACWPVTKKLTWSEPEASDLGG